MLTSMSPIVCLIACHGGPADHFATYAEVLAKKGYEVQIHATGPALKKFQERGIEVKTAFSLDNLTADEEDSLANGIAKTCSASPIIITDVGHIFDVKIQKALNVHAHESRRFAYYDNPEPFVPGGYSSTAAEVMEVSEGILFANDNLARAKIYSASGKEIDFADKKRFGIGYYPVSQAEKITEKRKSDHDIARSSFLIKNKIEDTGQKILVYFGGNNEEYFSKAFPAFLSFIAEASERIDLKNTVILLQQHPGAKVKNLDGQQIEALSKKYEGQANMPKIVLSDFSSDNAQILADAAFYYQTSMGPQFVLEGIPTIQIGHETYKDILVRNHLALSVTNADMLAQVIGNLEKMDKMPREDLLSSLGIKEDWPERLEKAIKKASDNSTAIKLNR